MGRFQAGRYNGQEIDSSRAIVQEPWLPESKLVEGSDPPPTKYVSRFLTDWVEANFILVLKEDSGDAGSKQTEAADECNMSVVL